MKKKIKVKVNHHDDENQLHYPHLHSGLISPPENMASKQVCHAGERERMQEGFCEQSSALKLKCKKGEIVEVHGGRILRSIGRKDRHSKICTVKGPRARRVRLSANTAIEFYDVQDRLGYGRPSEAIDWLMKEAKAAIDALGELPATMPYQQPEQDLEDHSLIHNLHQQLNEEEPINSLSFFAPSSPTGFQNLLNDTNSRTRSQSQGFCLSLQSFQNPMLLQSEPVLFPASTILNFEAIPTNWSNPQTLEIGSGNGEGREGFVFNSPSPPPPPPQWQQTVLGQNRLLSQGGTLQSSYPSFIHASMNPALSNSYLNYDQMPPSSGTGNLFSGDGFSGFRISPRIQGDEEKQNPILNKPGSSATCFLHYQD